MSRERRLTKKFVPTETLQNVDKARAKGRRIKATAAERNRRRKRAETKGKPTSSQCPSKKHSGRPTPKNNRKPSSTDTSTGSRKTGTTKRAVNPTTDKPIDKEEEDHTTSKRTPPNSAITRTHHNQQRTPQLSYNPAPTTQPPRPTDHRVDINRWDLRNSPQIQWIKCDRCERRASRGFANVQGSLEWDAPRAYILNSSILWLCERCRSNLRRKPKPNCFRMRQTKCDSRGFLPQPPPPNQTPKTNSDQRTESKQGPSSHQQNCATKEATK